MSEHSAENAPVHACPPPGGGVMPCCGRSPFEVPQTDRITMDPSRVTCSLKATVPDDAREAAAEALENAADAKTLAPEWARERCKHPGCNLWAWGSPRPGDDPRYCSYHEGYADALAAVAAILDGEDG